MSKNSTKRKNINKSQKTKKKQTNNKKIQSNKQTDEEIKSKSIDIEPIEVESTEINPEESTRERAVYMKDICSMEHYYYKDKTQKAVLNDITIDIYQKEVWGIIGEDEYELKLLLEIMANVKPYESGKCVLNNRGMMRRKRRILEHMFYIGDCDMVYKNMKVLEYLMFTTNKTKKNDLDRQEEFLNLLEEIQFSEVCLVSINNLKPQERAIVTLLLASISKSQLIIFNLPEVDFDEKLIKVISNIARRIRESNKAFVIASKNSILVDRVCEKTAFLKDGKLVYKDNTENLKNELDKVIAIIRTKETKKITEYLKVIYPKLGFEINEDSIYIYNDNNIKIDFNDFYRVCSKYGEDIDSIKKWNKSLYNVFKKVVEDSDL